ncbi:D-allulose 6-phosphate 3-epimerase [Photobacterium sp. DNB22_13_2]
MDIKIAPSLMCMNLMKLEEQLAFLNPLADFYHVDIMDGHYVPNITLSPYFVKQIKPFATLPIDVHLMVEKPEQYIEELAESGADYISLHAETINSKAFRLINKIKSLGCKVGIVINPATPVETIQHYVSSLDKITVMTVDPGFAGQPFIPETLQKISTLKDWKLTNKYNYLIEVDGSCNQNTYNDLLCSGAEVLVMGSTGLFGLSNDLTQAWDVMGQQLKASA